jgi:hypothetical protein
MTRLRRALRQLFSRLAAPRKPTPGAIARMRLEEFRRDSSCRWEIRPHSSECEWPFGTELGAFRDESSRDVTEQPANRIRISVSRLR